MKTQNYYAAGRELCTQLYIWIAIFNKIFRLLYSTFIQNSHSSINHISLKIYLCGNSPNKLQNSYLWLEILILHVIKRTSCLKQKNSLIALCSSAIHKYQNSPPWHRDTSSHKHCTSTLNSTCSIISNCMESFNWNWQSLTDSTNSLPFAEPESSLVLAILYDPANGPHQEPIQLQSTSLVLIYFHLLFKLLRAVSPSPCFRLNCNLYGHQ